MMGAGTLTQSPGIQQLSFSSIQRRTVAGNTGARQTLPMGSSPYAHNRMSENLQYARDKLNFLERTPDQRISGTSIEEQARLTPQEMNMEETDFQSLSPEKRPSHHRDSQSGSVNQKMQNMQQSALHTNLNSSAAHNNSVNKRRSATSISAMGPERSFGGGGKAGRSAKSPEARNRGGAAAQKIYTLEGEVEAGDYSFLRSSLHERRGLEKTGLYVSQKPESSDTFVVGGGSNTAMGGGATSSTNNGGTQHQQQTRVSQHQEPTSTSASVGRGSFHLNNRPESRRASKKHSTVDHNDTQSMHSRPPVVTLDPDMVSEMDLLTGDVRAADSAQIVEELKREVKQLSNDLGLVRSEKRKLETKEFETRKNLQEARKTP